MNFQGELEQRSYRGHTNIKMVGVQTEWTPDLLKEYKKCMEDPVYFIENYMKIINIDDGLVDFTMYDYQRDLIEHYNENRFSITLACRQSGKSVTTIGYLLWYALFNSEKTIAILANKGDTSREMLERFMLALENVPFFLQPGCREYNKGTITFENNTKVVARATSSSSIRGLSISLLYLDEFAFIENAEKFYTATYPVITSGKKSKVIITSTANGIGNPFYTIYQGAVTKANSFAAFRVDWWNVPGRDEEWKKETIRNTSELQFAQEFSNDFLGTGNTLINANAIMGLTALDPELIHESVKVYKTPEKGRQYIMAVDVAKGRGQDYSTFSIIDITEKPFDQVATFRDNLISPLLLPTVLFKYAKQYNDAFVIVENNDQGSVVCQILYYDLEYEEMYLSSIVKREGIGVTMDKKVKALGCSHLKDLVEQHLLIVHDKDTILEMATFVAKGKSYEADDGCHDDMVMGLVVFGWYAGTNMFDELFDENLKFLLFQQRMAAIEADLPPFGIIYNPVDEAIAAENNLEYEGMMEPMRTYESWD